MRLADALHPYRPPAVAAARRFLDEDMAERAAALAFYVLFSMIPLILIAGAVARLFVDAGSGAEVQETAREAGTSPGVAQVLRDLVETARSTSPEESGSVGIVGLVTLLYGASKAFTHAGHALDVLRGDGGRVHRPLRKRASDLGWTVVVIGCGLALAALVLLTGGLVERLLDLVGLGSVDAFLWSVARLPLAAAIALLLIALVNWAGPTGARRPFRLLTPGNLVATGLWLLASVGYAVYLDTFASYSATYGAFAALVILMLWIWFSCLAFLYGAALDVELSEPP